MIIKVDTDELKYLEHTCAVFDLQCHIFTMENNRLLKQAEILHSDGKDLDAETAWLLCCSVRNKEQRAWSK